MAYQGCGSNDPKNVVAVRGKYHRCVCSGVPLGHADPWQRRYVSSCGLPVLSHCHPPFDLPAARANLQPKSLCPAELEETCDATANSPRAQNTLSGCRRSSPAPVQGSAEQSNFNQPVGGKTRPRRFGGRPRDLQKMTKQSHNQTLLPAASDRQLPTDAPDASMSTARSARTPARAQTTSSRSSAP